MDIISPITGADVTGLTSPTYTLATMASPNQAAKQWYVSALGGTQPDVDVHSATRPFTVTAFAPNPIKVAPPSSVMNQRYGFMPSWPKNKHQILVRKNLSVSGDNLGNASSSIGMVRLEVEVPAGAEVLDLIEVKAMLSCAIGAALQNIEGLVASVQSGT